MQRWRRLWPLVAWLGALATGLVAFHTLGDGAMAPPPLTDPGAWGDWVGSREPAVAAVAVLRLVVLALAWYLVGATSVGIVARLVRRAGLIRVTDALTLPMVRRLLQASLGVTLATAMVGASTAPVPHPVDPPRMSVTREHTPDASVVRMATVDPVSEVAAHAPGLVRADEEAERPTRPGPREPVAMRLADQAVADGPSADEVPRSSAGASVDDRPSAEHGRSRHRVVAGESLWSIARDALARHRDGPPADREVLAYWREVVADNRDRLADPDNPDLIFPGDEVRLPTIPERA